MLETHYKLLKLLETNPELSQRDLADELGISLGKTNYCIKALMEKGLIKARNFKNNKNKLAYAYILTPRGFEEKVIITAKFLKRKRDEYEQLKGEIEELERETSNS